jgi:hypothetical protein
MSLYERVAGLPLEVESYALEGCELAFSEEFTRITTVVRLAGRGEEGVGEDVTYDGLDQVGLQAATESLPLAGSWTLGSFCAHLDGVSLWPTPPVREESRLYRRWAFESAALDLALRQSGRSLADALGRRPAPVHFVVSMRLAPFGSTVETADRLHALLARYPGTRFKLDPTNTWTRELVAELAATEAVDTLDLKGFYRGTPVDVETDPELYRMVVDGFPSAWIEDPDVTPETEPILAPHADRITWDAPIHSARDVEERPWRPQMINIKPSRIGSLRALFELYELCERTGIRAYGGGQTELGPGRGQIQYLASLFHPNAPNDTAPSGYNEPRVPDGLARSPLEPRICAAGFRWHA